MKTNQFEQRIKHAKLLHKNNHLKTCFKNGILIRHLYPDHHTDSLSWWDDFGFVINDYRVSVAWRHPRQMFRDFIENEAIETVLKDHPELALSNKNVEHKQNPVFKRVGKLRKKVKWYECTPISDNHFLTRVREKEQQLEAATDFQAMPSFDITWTNESRFVSACIPMEIHCEDDLVSLTSVIRRLIKRDVTINDLFPEYRYTRTDWKSEERLRNMKEFHVHRMR